MNCQMKPLISEYVDDALAPDRHRRVHAHLEECESCQRLAEDFRTMGRLLNGLPTAQTSAEFEGQLAERLAQARRPSPLASWLRRAGGVLWPAPTILRPALALGAAMLVTMGIVFHPSQLDTLQPSPPTPVSAGFDNPLVTHCVEQHRSYVAVQPLSDIAAQNLATQLDSTGALTSDDSVTVEEDNL
ncbi:MAG: zf-HC2 domain-containing protein [Armatimonadota bacterium]|nr:zf-HC2 domain-containing protein [Armatimonadota bacterium]